MLKGDVDNLSVLKAIPEAIRDTALEDIDIFSLNHDTVIEQLLESNNIAYRDGFGEKDGNLRKWKPEIFDDGEDKRIRLLKLHGSIDRRYFDVIDPSQNISEYGIYVGNSDIDEYYEDIFDSEGTIWRSNRPYILIGTDNKINSYFGPVFRELNRRFMKYLGSKDLLVVIGYCFGDSIINNIILEWLLNNEYKKMVVIDKVDSKDGFFRLTDYAIRKTFLEQNRGNTNKMHYISVGIERMNWQDIKNIINCL